MSSNNDMFSGIDLFTGYGQEVAQSRRTNQSQFRAPTVERDSDEANNTLSFQDMLLLMVTQLQNQTIDNQADPNDMMNQIIQMTVMQSLTEVSQQVEEMTLANVMNYASSLVGKEVTLGVYDEKGNVKEVYGIVEASGTYDGQQVIFVDGKSYFLSSIMAVGKLPPPKDPDGGGDETDPVDPPEGGDETDPVDPPEGGGTDSADPPADGGADPDGGNTDEPVG